MSRTSYTQNLPDGVKDDFILPCGHTVEQGRHLDCDMDGCRKTDERISEQYWREKKEGPVADERGTRIA